MKGDYMLFVLGLLGGTFFGMALDAAWQAIFHGCY